MKPGRVIPIVPLILALCAAAGADGIDDYVRSEMTRQRIVGLSLAVARDGRVVRARGYGLANVELNVPATPDTVYKLASVSKQFIASGIVLLAQEGKVGLDDSVRKYLPDAPSSWDVVTVRHLLTHTSGIVREAPGWSPLKEYTNHEVVEAAFPAPMDFQPGEKWQYCNVGYFTLGSIIEKVSGKPWGEFLRERIFQPLGMKATRVALRAEVIPNRASGYVHVGDTLQNEGVLLSVRTSGGLMSTVRDMLKWDAALHVEAPLTSSSREQMWTPVKLKDGRPRAYGFGWDLSRYRGHRQVQHGGSLGGFRTHLSRLLDDRLTVVVLTNTDSAKADSIARGVARRALEGLRLTSLKPAPDPDPATTRLLNDALVDFANKAAESPGMTPSLRRAITGASADKELLEQLKNLKAFEFLRREDVEGQGMHALDAPIDRILYYRLRAGKDTFGTFYLTEEGKVAFIETSLD